MVSFTLLFRPSTTPVDISPLATRFTFYGVPFAADGVFFVVDRSGSMNDSGELAIAKREIIQTLETLLPGTQFSVTFFDANLRYFPRNGHPAEINDKSRTAAINYVDSMDGGAGSCIQNALLIAIRFANLSTLESKVVIYVGDGGGTCGGNESEYHRQTLAVVTQQNWQRVPIYAFGVLMTGRTLQEQFLRRLVAMNDGIYVRVN
jgi:hypothetical protein